MEILASKEILAEWGAEHGFLGKRKIKQHQTTGHSRDTMGWEEPTGKQAHPGRLPGGGNLATDTREKKGSKMEGEGLGDQAPGRCWG